MKVNIKNLSNKERVKTLDALYTAASSLKGRDAVKRFLRDLLTESERVMLGRRILIAQKLLMGATYREISRALGVGRDTVHTVQNWLEDQMPGYEEAIKGMEREYDARRKKYTRPEFGTFAWLKKKYPVHFLIFTLADSLSGGKK